MTEDEDDPSELLRDPILHGIPAEWPPAFLRLRPSEQRWRGRIFLVAYILVGGNRSGGATAFAWSVALNRDPVVCADNRAIVEELPDHAILDGLDHLE